MLKIRILLSAILLATAFGARAGNDTIRHDTSREWLDAIIHGDLNDSTVNYPKFVKFCLKVYDWGDKTFNTYDPDYVIGTGHNWKARLVNDNWSDSYNMQYRGHDLNIRMMSNLNVNIGAYLHFMALSVGYSMDLNTLLGQRSKDRSRFETNFNCALFNLDVFYNKNDGGTYIRQFTGFNDDRPVRIYFPGVSMRNFGVDLYYFFNHGKYSQGAAYNFSKIQKRSAGSWLLGIHYGNLDVDMNFADLDKDLRPLYTFGKSRLIFHYYSFATLFGYGYNWVWHPKWLFNISVMPSIGVNKCYENSTDGNTALLSLNIHARTSVIYNHRALFAGIIGKISGNWYTSKSISLFNAIEYFSANVGVRF